MHPNGAETLEPHEHLYRKVIKPHHDLRVSTTEILQLGFLQGYS